MIEAITAFDHSLLETLYASRDPGLIQILEWLTIFGSWWVVYGLAFCVVVLLFLRKRFAYAIGLVISVASCGILLLISKGLVARVRPPIEFQAFPEAWYSFPSAHAALSVALYGFLLIVLWHSRNRTANEYVTLLAGGVLIFLIAFSRLYLGVHYASDVVAGLLLGGLCVWLGWKYAKIAHNGNT